MQHHLSKFTDIVPCLLYRTANYVPASETKYTKKKKRSKPLPQVIMCQWLPPVKFNCPAGYTLEAERQTPCKNPDGCRTKPTKAIRGVCKHHCAKNIMEVLTMQDAWGLERMHPRPQPLKPQAVKPATKIQGGQDGSSTQASSHGACGFKQLAKRVTKGWWRRG